MKKRIYIALIILLMSTGCTCEYNLQIENNIFKEEVKLTAKNNDELAQFKNEWQVSIDKNEGNVGTDPSTTEPTGNGIYEYTLSGNNLIFNNDFNQSNYEDSNAVSKCYNKLTVTNYQNSIIISTSSKAICFDNYLSLDSVIVNITVDKKVTSNNADSISGNTYTWKLNKNNVSNKAINLVLDNSDNKSSSSSSITTITNTKSKKDYTMYIFCGILLIAFLLGYLIFNKIKNKENNMDV